MSVARPAFAKMEPRVCPPLADLYSLPLAYGTDPSGVRWSPDGGTLAFLWNAEGELCRDLYVSRAGPARAPAAGTASQPAPLRLTDAARVPPAPVEDDERPVDDVSYRERMFGGVGGFDWSPDGRWLAFLCRGDLFRVPAEGGEPVRLTQSTGGKGSVQVSPDGRRIGFVSGANVWAYDTAAGALAQLTFFGKADVAVIDYQWSPDGRWLAVIVDDTSMYEKVRMPDYAPLKEVKVNELRRNNAGKPLSKTRVGLVPAAGGLMRRITLVEPGVEPKPLKPDELDTGNNVRVMSVTWTWDARRVLVGYRSSDYQTWVLGAASVDEPATLVELCREKQEPWFCHTSVGVDRANTHAYFLSFRSGWRQLYRVPLAGGPAVPVTQGTFDIQGFEVPKASADLFYAAHTPHPLECRVFRLPLAGGTPTLVSPDLPWSGFKASDDGRAVACISSAVMTPPELYRCAGSAAPQRVTHSPRSIFARMPRMTIERIAVPHPDGATVHARVMFPQDFDPAKRYPVMFSCVYAGQGKDAFGRYQLLDSYMANELGYIVVGVDLRASLGHGRDFLFGYHKRMGLIDSDELRTVAHYLMQRPYVDVARLGIWGGSYGGFLVLMAMTRYPGLFHTGISWKPVTDWRNYWDSYTVERLGRPADEPEAYRATSPVFHADKLAGNLLLVHGMLDDNVLFQDAVWMAQKLVEAGKYFDLMIYPRDDHGLTLRHESLPDLMERMAAYFEDKMGRGPG